MPAGGCGHRADRCDEAVHHDVDRELRAGRRPSAAAAITSRRSTGLARHSEETTASIELVLHLGGCDSFDALDPREETRVDRTGAGCHDESVEGREAHRRVDRNAAGDRRQRCAGSEMTGDEAQRFDWPFEQLGRLAGSRTGGSGHGSRTCGARGGCVHSHGIA